MLSTNDLLQSAIAYQQRGQIAEAESLYRQIISAEPGNVAAWRWLGVLAWQTNNQEAAIRCLHQAMEIKPDDAEHHHDLGQMLAAEGRPEEAEAHFRRAIALKPQYALGHYNLGTLLYERKQLDEAIHCLRRAIKADPQLVIAHHNLGLALFDQGKLEEATVCYRRALKLEPKLAPAHHNLGNTLAAMGEYEEALASEYKALELEPSYAQAHAGVAVLLLLTGEFKRGWPEYEWRWKTDKLVPRDFPQPRWEGQPLNGRTILLHAEQGLGDTFQFIRFAPLLKAHGATVIVECAKPEFKLLNNCQGIDQLIPAGNALPSFDYHIPLLSIPGVLGISLATIPANVPYLFANPDLIEAWRSKLDSPDKFRIGINWRGREGTGEFRKRDIPLDFFSGLAATPGIQLISLQKGGEQELRAAGDRLPIIELEGLDTANGAFMDTAAVMTNLDLVITSDTSIAHLAGGLGVPVWVALPFVPDWRWLLNRSDSPWYPTMRLFRQKKPGGWTDVFIEIEEAARKQLVHKQRRS